MQHTMGIKPENLARTAELLNVLVSDEYLLFTKTKNAHWNTEGRDFYEKHKFYEMQFDELDKIIDDIAERTRTLDHYVPATLKNFLQLTHLSERSDHINSLDFVKELLADHESIIEHLRQSISAVADDFIDPGTVDMITAIMEKHEKMAWMLRGQLK